MHNSKRFTDVVTRKENVTGVQFFQLTNSNRNLTQFRSSEIPYQPNLTARNGSLGMRQPEISTTFHKCVLIVLEINFEKLFFH